MCLSNTVVVTFLQSLLSNYCLKPLVASCPQTILRLSSKCPPTDCPPTDCPPTVFQLSSNCPPTDCPLNDCPPNDCPPTDCPLTVFQLSSDCPPTDCPPTVLQLSSSRLLRHPSPPFTHKSFVGTFPSPPHHQPRFVLVAASHRLSNLSPSSVRANALPAGRRQRLPEGRTGVVTHTPLSTGATCGTGRTLNQTQAMSSRRFSTKSH